MQNSEISSPSNQTSQSNENSQQQKTSVTTNSSFQSSSNHQTNRSSFLQKWIGGHSGQQDRHKLINRHQKSGGITWGEDVHYII